MFRLILRLLPSILKTPLLEFAARLHRKREMIKSFKYDYQRYLEFSENISKLSKDNLLGLIIRQYHVIEKGLTMPEPRLGFGRVVLKGLINNCILYSTKFEATNEQVHHAIEVVNEYMQLHNSTNYKISEDILSDFERLISLHPVKKAANQLGYTRNSYFEKVKSEFYQFSFSRHSVRNFSTQEVPIEKINSALKIAQNAPSACNRQPWRVKIFSDKDIINKILEIQGGNRGFGHLTNKLLLITCKTSYYAGSNERNAAYVDGGIYVMNLLYALHYNEIAGCILNASFNIDRDLKMRTLVNLEDSEVFVAIIVIGIPPESFKVAFSPRLDYHSISTYEDKM
jgi:nitroreductase